MGHYFAPGDRVRVRGDHEWPDGITGTIRMPGRFLMEWREPGEWEGCRLKFKSEKGWHVFYYVEFDMPQDDGSGDGPYSASEILLDHLEPLSPT